MVNLHAGHVDIFDICFSLFEFMFDLKKNF